MVDTPPFTCLKKRLVAIKKSKHLAHSLALQITLPILQTYHLEHSLGTKATLHTFPSSEVSKMTYDNAGEQAALQAQQVPMWAEDAEVGSPWN